MPPVHFKSAADFRAWLEAHHATESEIVVVMYKKDSGRGGITYAEALDEALCFGWIDGLKRGRDDESYTQRFTPRRPRSIWSTVNLRHIDRLTKAGRMHAAGIAAFKARDPKRTGLYSFENRPERFPPDLEQAFRRRAGAWKFFNAQPPGYRRTLIWWVISAKQTATQERRLARLMAESGAGRRIDLAKPFG